MAYFCNKCNSLMPPGTDRCKICGALLDGTVSKQRSLTELGSFVKQPKVISKDEMKAPYLPYEPRPLQLQIISEIRDTLDSGKHIVMESGTGTGKTIISLAAALEHAVPLGKKVIYLTRTISQSNQVMRELKAISSLKEIYGIAVTGRGKSCPLYRGLPNGETLPPNVLSSMCEEKKSKRQCPYFNTLKDRLPEVSNYCKTAYPKSDELDAYCEKIHTCPYEMKKLLMKEMNVVAVPYIQILSEDIRNNLLNNMDVEDDQVLIIIDEAHNIIDAAREQDSFSISIRMIESAIDECSTMKGGDVPLNEKLSLKPFLEELRRIVRGLANQKLDLKVKEALLKEDDVEQRIFDKFLITRAQLSLALDQMTEIGEIRTELLMEKGETKISPIYDLSLLLKKWIMTDDEMFIKSVRTDLDGEYLRAACINPKDVTFFLRKQKGMIHMSGTLQPLEQYVKTMNLPQDTVMKIYPSPFPKENRKVVYMDNVTTKYEDRQKDPSIFSRMERNLAKMCNAVDKNTLVFFTSYSMMREMRPFLERDIRKELYWEESGRPRNTMIALDKFRSGRNGVFFSVMGGSIAEGIDFPGEELSFAIIVGIPYPPPSLELKAMSDLYDKKFGPWKGMEYTSVVPAIRKMKQAIGRLIRTETDRGMAVIMDYRASKYKKILEADLTTDPVGDVARFFEHR